MELDGYTAVIQYNPETDEFRGEVQGINGGTDFYGKTPEELRREFRASLDFFLHTCAKHGISPHAAHNLSSQSTTSRTSEQLRRARAQGQSVSDRGRLRSALQEDTRAAQQTQAIAQLIERIQGADRD